MEVQFDLPTWGAPDGCTVAFAGRLDSRADLAFGSSSDCDAALAWNAWREGRLDRLLGDWVLAVWAPAEQRLWLARDPVGLRRLFYRRDGQRVQLSTALRPLIRPADPWDQTFLYRFLRELPLGDATPLKPIRLVPRGRLIEMTADQERVGAPFWDPWVEGPLRLDRPEAYAEVFRSLFTTAVRDRLVDGGSVLGMTLSGGLDSGSVGTMAAHLMRTGRVPAVPIQPIFYDYQVAEAAEQTYLTANAVAMGVTPETIPAEPIIRATWTAPAVVGTDWPITNLMGWPIIREAVDRFRAAGVRTVLTGRGGDALLAGYPESILDELYAGRLRSATQHLQSWANAFHVGPLTLLRRLLAGRPWRELATDPPDWFTAHPIGEELPLPVPPRWVSRAQRAAHTVFWSAPEEGGSELASLGIEERWPLLDRRLLALTFRIDRTLLESPTETKTLLRAAMRGILPEAVRLRQSKSLQTGLLVTWLQHQRPFFEELLRSDLGAPFDFLRRETVTDQLRLAVQGQTTGLGLLVHLYALLVWMAEVKSEAHRRDLDAPDGRHHAGLSPALGSAGGGGYGV
ncbi:MAG TPA: asparagine synthase-related protein [Symbiobacteriaceae bacterium]|nr:asparagine synthase-related protein [Symbiobacteriaceae bacterium]